MICSLFIPAPTEVTALDRKESAEATFGNFSEGYVNSEFVHACALTLVDKAVFMSGLYLNTNTSTGSLGSLSSSSSAPLPFPEPLPRSDFLAPEFEPSTYLSSLGHRHQTLEDLRSDLRARSQLLGQELLDLVNSHYNDFLSLGSSLKGGEDKVEELRVGLLSLRREVESVRAEVRSKEDSVGALLAERRKLRSELENGQRILEWDERLTALESSLMLEPFEAEAEAEETTTGIPKADREAAAEEDELSSDDDYDELLGSDAEDSEESDEQEETSRAAVARVRRRVREYLALQLTARRIGEEHSFVIAQQSRLLRIRNTLLLDIRSAHRQSNGAANGNPSALLKIMALYRQMDASHEAISILGASKLNGH